MPADDIRHCRACSYLGNADRGDFIEAASKANDNPGNAAVPDQQVRADADNHDRNVERAAREEIGEIVLVGWREQNLRRPANAQPGQVAERDVG